MIYRFVDEVVCFCFLKGTVEGRKNLALKRVIKIVSISSEKMN